VSFLLQVVITILPTLLSGGMSPEGSGIRDVGRVSSLTPGPCGQLLQAVPMSRDSNSPDYQIPRSATTTEVFDFQDAVRRLGSERLLQKVAFLFLANSPNLMAQVREGLAAGDVKIVERSAHTLVSAMAYFSAKSATDATRTMEQIGREGDLASAGSALETLESEIARLRAAVSRLLPEEGIPRES